MRAVLAVSMLAATATAQPQPPEPVTFRQAVARAIAQNPDRLIALDEITRVNGLLMQVNAALWPQLSLGGAYTRLEGNRYVNMNLENAANSFIGDVTLTTPIVDLRALAERRRALDQLDVTTRDAQSTKRDVAIAAARAYFAAYTAARELEIATHARDNAKGHADYTAQRHAGGVGTDLDVKRALVELADDEATVANALTAKIRAEEALGVITASDHPLSAATEPDLGAPLEGAGIAARADVIASVHAHDAALWSAAHDWWDWVPALSLGGEGFVTDPALPPVPRFGYDIAITLTVPIFDGGFRLGSHEQHRALLAEAGERDAATAREATSEVRAARLALVDTRAARDAARRAATAAQDVLDLAITGFRAGTATSLDVIDAQRGQLDAATAALLAEDNYRQAELDLLAATGAFPKAP